MPRLLDEDVRGASNTTRLEGDTGIGKELGPRPCRSSRLMSSKCERSLGPMMSERVEEWKDEDLDDLELVRSGGEPGAPPRAPLDSEA